MIVFENVSFEYDKSKAVLSDLSFGVEKGEPVGLIGANGAGKTTLLKAILGLIGFTGKVTVDGLEVTSKNLARLRKDVGFVLQNSDNQMFMPTVIEDMIFAPLNYGIDRKTAIEAAEEVLKRLGVEHLRDAYNHKLSGGEKRMAAIATILTMNPKVIVMDEPSATLDPYSRRRVIEAVNSLDNTKIIASHDLDFILDTCTKVILLDNGRVAAIGKTTEILKNRELLEANRLELPLSFSIRY